MACVTAHASVTILATQVTEQDMYKFAMPVGETYQNILNQMQYNSKVVSIEQFQPEYLITATDFTKGDLTLGYAALARQGDWSGFDRLQYRQHHH